jgi:hypothetical protein
LKPLIGYSVKLFKEYMQRGYYSFGDVEDYMVLLRQIIAQTMETDIPMYANNPNRYAKNIFSFGIVGNSSFALLSR